MAMASSGTKIVPESSSKLMGGLNLSILSEECEAGGCVAWPSASKAGHLHSLSDSLQSSATGAAKESSLHIIDLQSDSSSSSTSSYKGKLPMVLEESESLSHREGSSIWDTSSSSHSSITSSSASSTRAFFRRGASADGVQKSKKPQKLHKRRDCKETSFVSLLLWPLKKVRDGYMSCIMGLDGSGDLSGLAQGSTFATSAKYFADLPLSKTDSRNHG